MMANLQDSFLQVLIHARVTDEKHDGWMRRSKIVKLAYEDSVEVNAYHRSLLDRLVAIGAAECRECSKGFNRWFEYRAVC